LQFYFIWAGRVCVIFCCWQKNTVMKVPLLHVCWWCGEVRTKARPFLLLENVNQVPTLCPSEWVDPCAGCCPLRLWWLEPTSDGFILYPEACL
jgi:hypothetical protein